MHMSSVFGNMPLEHQPDNPSTRHHLKVASIDIHGGYTHACVYAYKTQQVNCFMLHGSPEFDKCRSTV